MSLHLLLGDINPAMADRFYRWLYGPDTGDRELLLSSRGGDVGLMTGMYDTLIEYDIPTVAAGIVQDEAAVLFLAGAKRAMYPNAMLRFTEPPLDKVVHSLNQKAADENWFILTKLIALVNQRTGMDLADAHDLFDGKYIETQRALALGLCDEIRNGGSDGTIGGIPSS